METAQSTIECIQAFIGYGMVIVLCVAGLLAFLGGLNAPHYSKQQ